MSVEGKAQQGCDNNPWDSFQVTPDVKFLVEAVKDPTRKVVLLDLILIIRKAGGSLGCRDHGLWSSVSGKDEEHQIAALDFRRTKCSLFRELHGRMPWEWPCRKVSPTSWSVFEDSFLQVQGRCIHPHGLASEEKETCMVEQGMGKTQTWDGNRDRIPRMNTWI